MKKSDQQSWVAQRPPSSCAGKSQLPHLPNFAIRQPEQNDIPCAPPWTVPHLQHLPVLDAQSIHMVSPSSSYSFLPLHMLQTINLVQGSGKRDKSSFYHFHPIHPWAITVTPGTATPVAKTRNSAGLHTARTSICCTNAQYAALRKHACSSHSFCVSAANATSCHCNCSNWA